MPRLAVSVGWSMNTAADTNVAEYAQVAFAGDQVADGGGLHIKKMLGYRQPPPPFT